MADTTPTTPCVVAKLARATSGLCATVTVDVAAHLTAANPAAAWVAAMNKFETCRADEVAFDQEVWMPAHEASETGGPRIPDYIDAHMDRLTDARCAAEDALIETPGPTLTAAIWKMEYAHKRWEEFTGWPDDWWNAVMLFVGLPSPPTTTDDRP